MHLVFAVSSYSSHDLSQLAGISLQLLDNTQRKDHVLSDSKLPSGGRSFSAFVGGVLARQTDGTWSFRECTTTVQARGFSEVVSAMQRALEGYVANLVVQPPPASLQLVKGEVMVLQSMGNRSYVKHVTLGLGWDAIGQGHAIDLDASCVMFDGNDQKVDAVCFSNLRSATGAVVHAGDNLTGEGEGDDEKIFANLHKLPVHVRTLYFVINSYSGHTFQQVQNAYVRLLQVTPSTMWSEGKELCRFQLSTGRASSASHTAMLMCRLRRRSDGAWTVKALGHGGAGRMYQDSVGMMMKDLTGRLKLDLNSSYKPIAAPSSSHVPTSSRGGQNSSMANSQSNNNSESSTHILMGLIAFLVILLLIKTA
jgi:tellurium resistance protein TerZ